MKYGIATIAEQRARTLAIASGTRQRTNDEPKVWFPSMAAAMQAVPTTPEQESRMTLTKRDFLAFNAAVTGAFNPNQALQSALKAASKVKRA